MLQAWGFKGYGRLNGAVLFFGQIHLNHFFKIVQRKFVGNHAVQLDFALELRGGAHRVAVGLREHLTGETGFLCRSVDVERLSEDG